MKKITLFIAICISTLSVVTQNLSISYQGGILQPNEEIFLQGSASYNEIVAELDVTNNSGNDLSVLVKKVENYLVMGSYNAFVWGGINYAPFVYISLHSHTIPAGGTTGDDGFLGYYGPNSNPGQSSISYVFFDEYNPNDSVSVIVLYNALDKIDNFPYVESFETGINDWSQTLDDDFDWTHWQELTPTSGTGPNGAYHGSYYLYTEATNNNPNKTAGLYVTCDFSGLSFPCISYCYNMYGVNMGSLRVQVSTDNGMTWTDEWNLTGEQGDAWISNTINLSTYGNNSNVMIRFWAFTGDGNMSDMAIDLVEIYDGLPPECTLPIYPQNQEVNVKVDTMLQWNNSSYATGYILYFGTDNPPTNIENGIDLGNTISFSPSFNLEYGSTYYWRIVPYNQFGNATGCNIWQFETISRLLNLSVFLEGSYNGIDMNTELNNAGLIPLAQPYNTAPWDYDGTESVPSIPNGDVVDWVLAELRETSGDPSSALPDSVVARKAVFLLNNGQIVDLDGISLPEFDITITDNVYVVLWHRNHLAIMSSIPLAESIGGTYQYDFTNQLERAYMNGQKEIGTGIYGMMAGDCDGSGIIDMEDKNNNWGIIAGEMGYDGADVNLDSEINNLDKDDFLYWNIGSESQVPTEVTFACGDLISDIDGNTYNTVQIGFQCWMSENLKTTTYQNGISIPNVTNSIDWQNLLTGAYVWYDNDISWKNEYGALYNWFTTIDSSGICPTGWHVPTHDEWTELTDLVGLPNGNKLKSCRQVNSPLGGNCDTTEHPRWDETTNGNYGTDDYGFSGLPGGFRFNGGFFNLGWSGFWWSSTHYHIDNSWVRTLYCNSGEVNYHGLPWDDGLSVRCIKD